MQLTVRLFAGLRERAGTSELVVADLPRGLDIGALKRELERRRPELGSLAHVAGVIGTQYVRDDTPIDEGDVVSLLPPVSGGAPPTDERERLARGVFELCAAALDPARCQQRVQEAVHGAVVQFTGTTRAHNRGQEVVRLEYEAFEAMTGPEMARIFERCRAELTRAGVTPPLALLCQHRTGAVEVGEPSVVIAVASGHRDAAFTACRFLIDELKATLPIWKKEVYADGHTWIGERS